MRIENCFYLYENRLLADKYGGGIFVLVCFSCCLLSRRHSTQEILYYGNSSVSVLIKMQPLSLFF